MIKKIYNRENFILDEFIGKLIKKGYKLRAFKLVLMILVKLKLYTKKDPLVVLRKAIDNLRPCLTLKKKKIAK